MVTQGWTILEFVSEGGRVPFTDWLLDQEEDAQAVIDVRILTLKGMPHPWPSSWARSYTGYERLMELRIAHNRVQYRPLGCYGPNKQEFILLAGAIEKDWKLPKSILKAAMERMQLVMVNRRWVREYSFDSAKSMEETGE